MSAPSSVSRCGRDPRYPVNAPQPRTPLPRWAACLLLFAFTACASHAPQQGGALPPAASEREADVRADADADDGIRRPSAPATLDELTELDGPKAPSFDTDARELERVARRSFEAAHQLIGEERLEHALHWTGRGLEAAPDDPALLRLRADLLDRLGRADQSEALRARAEELDPPPPLLADSALPFASERLRVILLPPHAPGERWSRYPSDWPNGGVADTLLDRLAVRLPRAAISLLRNDALASVSEARALLALQPTASALSLRVDRSVCDQIPGQPPFAMAWIRWAHVRPARVSQNRHPSPNGRAEVVRLALDNPQWRGDCRSQVVARALEEVLRRAGLRDAPKHPNEAPTGADSGTPAVARATLSTDSSNPNNPNNWRAADLRELFPSLERRVQQDLANGLASLSRGALGAAQAAFQRALEVDSEDADALAYLQELDAAQGLSQQLDSQRRSRWANLTDADLTDGELTDAAGARDVANAGPIFTNVALRLAEGQLAREQTRRKELLAALEVLHAEREAPTPETLDVLHPVAIRDMQARGPRLARARSAGSRSAATHPARSRTAHLTTANEPLHTRISARALFAPNGDVLARYYFAEGVEAPLLREEDTNGDGWPNRWVAYEAGMRREVWQDHGREDSGGPASAHWVFALGGRELERVEFDSSGDGQPDRVLRYVDGLLAEEERDTSGDGRFDRFDRYAKDGQLDSRREDLNGDGEIDVRTLYRSGRITRREIRNATALDPRN